MGGLPWIKVFVEIPNHPKVGRLEAELAVDDGLGILVRVWCWVATYHPDGVVPEADAYALGRAAWGPWPLDDGGNVTRDIADMVPALVNSGLLDKSFGGFLVHDWDSVQAAHFASHEKRKAQDRERKRKQRLKGAADVTRTVTEDVTRTSTSQMEREIESSTVAKATVPRKPGRKRDPLLDAAKELLASAYREVKSEDIDWKPSAWGDLQAVRRVLADDVELIRRWRLFLVDTYWPLKSVNAFRRAFQHPKFQKPNGTAGSTLPGVTVVSS